MLLGAQIFRPIVCLRYLRMVDVTIMANDFMRYLWNDRLSGSVVVVNLEIRMAVPTVR